MDMNKSGETKMRSDDAIKQIAYLKELTEKSRLRTARSYPWFIIWGLYMIFQYLSFAFWHAFWMKWWWILLAIAYAFTIIFIYIYSKNGKLKFVPPLLKKIGMQCLILMIAGVTIFMTFLKYNASSEANVFWPFLIGVIYIVAGVHFGRDAILLGLWQVIVSIAGVFIPIPYQYIWLAVMAGGGQLFTGILFGYKVRKTGRESE